jgi:UDP-N-acetylmuramoyl-L-alanyl-D-glutamate--2,6-diaminopimelate ligase
MGKASIELSDYVIVTSDNPRTENPQRIMDEIEAGVREAMRAPARRASGYKLILDRGAAIEEAIQMAKEGDLVVVAGKGHECYQIIGNKKLHFDDREEVKKAIAQRKGKC